MKICFCIDSIVSGGAERVMVLLANQLSCMQNEVSLIITSERTKKSFYPISKLVNTYFICNGDKRKINLFKKIKRLRKSIKYISPDVVISFLPHVDVYTHIALIGLKIPHIVSERNNPYTDPESKLMRLLKQYVFKKSSGCVFQTKDARNYYLKKLKCKTRIIYNPLVLENAEKKTCKNTKTIISVGRLEPQKNFSMLLKAFKIFHITHKDYSLHIIGIGYLLDTLKKECEILGINEYVVFEGELKDWKSKYSNSDIFVLSSDYEGLPNALIEAMALGIPCISTDCPIGGPKEFIKDGINGCLVPVGDYEALADTMNKILKLNLYNNKDLIRRLDVETISNEWLDFLDECINGRV